MVDDPKLMERPIVVANGEADLVTRGVLEIVG